MAVPKVKDGEYMGLVWDWGEPDHEYVRGHVSAQGALNAIIPEVEHDGTTDEDFDVEKVRHLWAHYSPINGRDYDMRINFHTEPGPGRFKITEVPYK